MSEIVNSVAYAEGRRMGDAPLERVSEILRDQARFVWIGLLEPDGELLRRVQEEFGLHELAIEDALRAHQRPKLEEYGACLFVVLRTAQIDAVTKSLAFGETHVFVGANYVVSVRHGASLSYADVRARCESRPDFLRQGPGFVLYAIMDFVVDQYFPIIDELEDELEALEQSIFESTTRRDAARRIYRLKRDLLLLKRGIAPLVEVCNRLVRFDVHVVHDETRLYFRDVYDHVIRINETIDNMRELLTSALESNLSLISVRQNEVMKRLGSWGAILALPTMVAGIYGMNFEFMPELHARWGYPAVLGAMAAGCVALYVLFKRASWL